MSNAPEPAILGELHVGASANNSGRSLMKVIVNRECEFHHGCPDLAEFISQPTSGFNCVEL